MLENGGKTRHVIERIGGASRARTDDLIVVNDGRLPIYRFCLLRVAGRVRSISVQFSSKRKITLAGSLPQLPCPGCAH